MNVIFIVNEQAGGGKGALVWHKLQQFLTIPYEAHVTKFSGHAVQLAKAYTYNKDENIMIIAVGGDGTMHEVIEGAAGYAHIQIGAVKAGSGNDFARGYHIFRSIDELQQYYYENHKADHAMDLGNIVLSSGERQSFVNNTGIGFDAYITTMVNGSKLKSWLNVIGLGRLSYMLLTIWALFTFKRFNAIVECNGETYIFKKVWFISICNQPYFGGGMKISPKSKSDDRILELTVVHNLSRLKLLLVFATVFWGKHESFREVTMIRGDHFEMKIDTTTISHVDGELLGYVHANEHVKCSLDDRQWFLAK